METKICTKCHEEKPLDEFSNAKRNKDGHTGICKKCNVIYFKEYNKKYITNPINKENAKIRAKKYVDDPTNKEKILITKKKFRDNPINKDNARIYKRKYKTNRRNVDNLYKITENLRTLIRGSIKRNGYTNKSRTHDILGCSYDWFILHLESKFEPWMNWDNYGLYNGEPNYGWDIDHITPLSSATTEEELLILNHHDNLQPLCSYINRDVKKHLMNWM